MNQPAKGALFRIPVTVVKPQPLDGQIDVEWDGMEFKSGQVRRHYVKVPAGATWAGQSDKDCSVLCVKILSLIQTNVEYFKWSNSQSFN